MTTAQAYALTLFDDMDTPARAGFDYAALNTDARHVVQRCTTEIHERTRRARQDMIAVGQRLIEVKAQLGHGQFGNWLKAEFAWSDQTALNLMNVARMGDHIPNHLEIAPTVLYALAAPSTPTEVRTAIIDRAAQGEVITVATVKALINDPIIDPIIDPIAPTEAQPAERDGNEWYTPRPWLDAARTLFGGRIDLDPASCAVANTQVCATRFYTKDDDGLAQPWHGNVWCNPPYSYPEIEHFTSKAITEYQNGNAQAILILVNNCTDAGWFVRLAELYPVLFSRGRTSFWRPDQTQFANRQGQAIFYLGTDTPAFIAAFHDLAYRVQ